MVDLFKRVKNKYNWRLMPDGSIRGFDSKGNCYCPVNSLVGTPNSIVYDEAAETLGLTEECADKISCAADNVKGHGLFDENVRQELMYALGLIKHL